MRRARLALFLCLCLILPAAAYSVPSDTIVYVTPSGSKYHREDCTYTTTVRSMTIEQAERKGYGACSRCDPDVLTGSYTSNWDGKSGSSSKSTSAVIKRPVTPSTAPVQEAKDDQSGVKTPVVVLSLVCFVLLITAISLRSKLKETQAALLAAESDLSAVGIKFHETKSMLEYELKKARADLSAAKIEAQKSKWILDYDGKELRSAFNIPDEMGINEAGEPFLLHGRKNALTVYLKQHGGVYHHKRCRYASGSPAPMWTAISAGYRPCKACAPRYYDFSWYHSLTLVKSEMERTGIKMVVRNGIIHIQDINSPEPLDSIPAPAPPPPPPAREYVYAEAANGMTARVLLDKLADWQKAQEEIKAGKRTADPEKAARLSALMRGEAPQEPQGDNSLPQKSDTSS